MEQLIAIIEKGQPFFNAIARNKYLKAIRDGFISVIPIIIFSSIFCLVASVPNIWGFYWPDDINNALWKCYNFSMGILAIACAATTAKHFADAQNRDLPQEQPDQLHLVHVRGHHRLLAPFERHHRHGRRQRLQHHLSWFQGPANRLHRCVCDRHHLQVLYQAQHHRQDARAGSAPTSRRPLRTSSPSLSASPSFGSLIIVFRAAFGICFAQGVIQVFQPCSPLPTATSALL